MIRRAGFALDDAFGHRPAPSAQALGADRSLRGAADRVRTAGGDRDRFWSAYSAGHAALPPGVHADPRSLGVVAAWRSGIPGFRADALMRIRAAVNETPAATPAFAAALGLAAADMSAFLRMQLDDPFAWPAPVPVVGQVGGFRGLGGRFAAGPDAVAAGPATGLAFIRCGGETWSLRADIFGAALDPSTPVPDDLEWSSSAALSGSVAAHRYPTSYLVWLRRGTHV